MISYDVVCAILNDRGIKARFQNMNLDSDEKKDVIKGIVVETGDASKEHAFCVDLLMQGAESAEKAADLIQQFTEKSKLSEGIDFTKYLNKEYLSKNVKTALKSRLWSPFITKDSIFPEVQEFCYITDVYRKENIRWMLEIRKDHIDQAGIMESDLWSYADKNTKTYYDFVLRPMSEILGRNAMQMLQHSPLKDVFSVSNIFGLNGAVQVFNRRMKDICTNYLTTGIIVYLQSCNNALVGPDIQGVKDALMHVAENDMNGQQLVNSLFRIRFDGDDLVIDDSFPYVPKV